MSEPLWVPIGAVSAVGDELAYAEVTTNVPLTATTDATANTIVTAPAITVDGLTPILVEFYAMGVGTPATANSYSLLVLFEDGNPVGRIGFVQTPAAGGLNVPVYVRGRRTPTAGSHTYSIRGFVSGGTHQVQAGPGGASGNTPAFIRVSTVRPTGVGAGGAAVPACRVRRTTAQSLGNGGEVPIYFDVEDFDTDSMHDLVTNAERITVRTAGKYVFGANVSFALHATGSRALGIKKGADYLAYTAVPATVGTLGTTLALSGIFDFAVNDYIVVVGYQNSGGSLNVDSNPYYSPVLSMHKIG